MPAEDDGKVDLGEATKELQKIVGEICHLTGAHERNAHVIARWEEMMCEAVPTLSHRASELVEAMGQLERPMNEEELADLADVLRKMTELMSGIASFDRPPTDLIVLWYVRNMDERLKNVEGRL